MKVGDKKEPLQPDVQAGWWPAGWPGEGVGQETWAPTGPAPKPGGWDRGRMAGEGAQDPESQPRLTSLSNYPIISQQFIGPANQRRLINIKG